MSTPDREIITALERLGLLCSGRETRFEPLTGGVSSDIWRVDTVERRFCVKRALAKLRVAADWRAPVERNGHEVHWFRVVGEILPSATPQILGHDPEAGLFAMAYLDPADYRLWKKELQAGRVDPEDARRVGAALALIHAGTAGRAEVARMFPTDAIFHQIRLAPYLEAAAEAHPDLSERLQALIRITAQNKRALVHGDVSPKNILLGTAGPVFLDAECAWYGDPAFDVAFCLNHLLLKCLWVPAARDDLLRAFSIMASRYFEGVDWESREVLEARVAHLLPGLFLARVDGKSPVEYLDNEADKQRVRRVARALLARPVERLADIRGFWERELTS